jgi:hypothetical protein
MWKRTKEIVKQAKGLYSWYSFGSNIVGWIVPLGLFSGLGVSVVGVVTAVIKGVPWPITLMAGFSTLLAGTCLVATPLIIRVAMPAMQPVSEPNKTPEPDKPNYDAWKLVDKFTVRKAACLLENLEPATNQHDPKIEPWIAALCAEIRKEELKFIPNMEWIDPYNLSDDWEYWETKKQRENPDANTEIPKAALMDFAKRHKIDLECLGQ